MNTPLRGGGAEGVGLAYHPFLHDALLAGIGGFDFVELPLDLYVDPARAGMLDPAERRLDEVIAAAPCVWSGSVLSLGSVEDGQDAAPSAWLAARIRTLLARAGAPGLTEAIGFRRLGPQDLGSPQGLPYCETAARWLATRAAAASAAVGCRITLRAVAAPIAAPETAWSGSEFLHRVAALTGSGLVLDVGHVTALAATARLAPAALAHRLPGCQVTTLRLAAEREEEWALLPALLACTAARSVVIRRDDSLFPVDTIARDARRAAALLAQAADRTPQHLLAPPPMDDPADGLARLRADQASLVGYLSDPAPASVPAILADVPAAVRDGLALRVQAWRNWRAQVDDTFKAHQIGQFLSRDAQLRGGTG